MNTPAVSVVLVNYNTGTELRRTLQSIANDLASTCWEALVVDNASSDGSGAIAEEFGARVRLIRNATNVGFGRGINQAVAATAAPLVLIINPDCQLIAGAVTTLAEEMEQYADCALVGPRMLDPDGSVQGSARGDPDMLTGLFGRTALFRRLLPNSDAAQRNVVTARALQNGEPSVIVDWVSGACMLVRRQALAAVGGFDERYFLYWEDADLCRRLRAHGYHVRYVPTATAVHQVGHSSRTAPAERGFCSTPMDAATPTRGPF